jgi:uncharacterized membrane protein (DUF2068 family)
MARPKPVAAVQRVLPMFHYELLVCGTRGHMLVGTDAAEVREADADFVRESGGRRWYRCLRCDSWVPLAAPGHPTRPYPAPAADVELPLRGRALRDRIILRLIAIDRAFHVVLLAGLAVLIFVFASHRAQLQRLVDKIDAAFYGSAAAGRAHHAHGILHDIERLVTLNVSTLRLIGFAALAYAILEGAEAVGLWYGRRWAEYLTLVATAVFLPLEIYELTKNVTVLKVLALVVNVAIVAYLLYAKRLFGVRGGAAAERAAREASMGWDAFHRETPPPFSPPAPAATPAPRASSAAEPLSGTTPAPPG